MTLQSARRPGFSLVELLVCLALMTALAGGFSWALRPPAFRLFDSETRRLERWTMFHLGRADRSARRCAFRLHIEHGRWVLAARLEDQSDEDIFLPRSPVTLAHQDVLTDRVWVYSPVVHTMTPAARWTLTGQGGKAQVVVSGRGMVSLVTIKNPSGLAH